MQSAEKHDYWVDDTIPFPVADGRPVIRGPRVHIPPRETSGPGSQNWAGRVLSALRDPVYRSSYALVLNTVGTSVIGIVFWAAAAHLYSREALGRAAALISALMLVATLSQLNLNNTLIRFLPQMGAKSSRRLINVSYLVSMLMGLAGSVIFVTIITRISSQWRFVDDSVSFAVIFAVSVVVWAIFCLQDAALVGLQHASVVPKENVVYALMKLALLVGAARLLGSTDILFSWIMPLILLIPAINWLIFHRYLRDRGPQDLVPGLGFRRFARFASVDSAGAVCNQIATNVLPLLVISVLGAGAAASFYVACLITSGVASVGSNFSTGLLVEGAATPDRLAEITRGSLKRCMMVMVPATIGLVFGAPLILRIYGGSYVTQTVVLFQLLAMTFVPVGIETIAYSLDRIAGKPIRATLSQLAIAVLTLGGSWILFGRLGLNGVGVACLGADTVVALARLPTVLAVLRRPPGVLVRPTVAAQQAAVPASHALAHPHQPPSGRNYTGRHRATGPGRPTPRATGRPDPRAPSRPDPRAPSRPDPRVLSRPDPRVPSRPDPRTTGRPDPRTTGRPDPRVTGRPDPRVPGRPDPRITGRPDPRILGRPDPRATGRPDPQVTGRPDPRATGGPHPRATGGPDPRATGGPDPRATGGPDPRATGRPDPRVTGRPDSRATGGPDPRAPGRAEQQVNGGNLYLPRPVGGP